MVYASRCRKVDNKIRATAGVFTGASEAVGMNDGEAGAERVFLPTLQFWIVLMPSLSLAVNYRRTKRKRQDRRPNLMQCRNPRDYQPHNFFRIVLHPGHRNECHIRTPP
jgi:hypothetical protein